MQDSEQATIPFYKHSFNPVQQNGYAEKDPGQTENNLKPREHRSNQQPQERNSSGKIPDLTIKAGKAPADDEATIYTKDRKGPFFAWLLCLRGPDRWHDFRIAHASTSIGRDKACDISLSDTFLSPDTPSAMITYNEEKHIYFIKTAKENLLEANLQLNGEPVRSLTLMQPYDRIQIGQSELLFIPVCCDKFNYDEEKSSANPNENKKQTHAESGAQIIRCPYGHYYDSRLYSRCPTCNPGDKRPIDRLALAEEIWKENHAEAQKQDPS